MTLMLTFEQSVDYLEGHWAAFLVEWDVVEDLQRRNVHAPVAVVLYDDTTVAFYVSEGMIL